MIEELLLARNVTLQKFMSHKNLNLEIKMMWTEVRQSTPMPIRLFLRSLSNDNKLYRNVAWWNNSLLTNEPSLGSKSGENHFRRRQTLRYQTTLSSMWLQRNLFFNFNSTKMKQKTFLPFKISIVNHTFLDGNLKRFFHKD